MSAIVVDTSALMRMVQTRPDAKLYQQVIVDADCYAPSLVVSELANALWKTVQFSDLKPDEADQLLSDMIAIPRLVDDERLVRQALEIAIDSNHPAYDCLFIALARVMNAPVLTADKKLRRKFPNDKFLGVDI